MGGLFSKPKVPDVAGAIARMVAEHDRRMQAMLEEFQKSTSKHREQELEEARKRLQDEFDHKLKQKLAENKEEALRILEEADRFVAEERRKAQEFCNKNLDAVKDLVRMLREGGHINFDHLEVHWGNINSVLGCGAFGKVYKGIYRLNGQQQDVAVKVLTSHTMDAANDTSISDLLKREALMMRDVCTKKNPNIVSFYGWTTGVVPTHGTKPSYMLVTAFVHGQTLDDFVRRPPALMVGAHEVYGPELMLPILRQIASAMTFVHSMDCVHRDLKSANVMIGGTNQVTVIDFGLGKDLREELMKGGSRSSSSVAGQRTTTIRTNNGPQLLTTVAGTDNYMAPEILLETFNTTGKTKREITDALKAADVASFGFLAYEVLCRAVPWSGFHVGQIKEAVRAGDRPKIPQDILDSADLRIQGIKDLLQDCWDTDPMRRPTFERIAQILDMISRGKLPKRSDGYLVDLAFDPNEETSAIPSRLIRSNAPISQAAPAPSSRQTSSICRTGYSTASPATSSNSVQPQPVSVTKLVTSSDPAVREFMISTGASETTAKEWLTLANGEVKNAITWYRESK